MSRKRKTVICKRCGKEKKHFGLGMCSACLRRTKRETRPSFYLGTCYSEMSRRIKTFDKLRPNYYGLTKCTKEEFLNKFLEDESFLELYKGWQESGFQRRMAPSIDRIDNKKGYTLDNIEFISHGENSCKDKKVPVRLHEKNGTVTEFETMQDAGKYVGRDTATIFRWLRLKDGYSPDGYYFVEEIK